MDEIIVDLHFGLRQPRLNPAFIVVAVLFLALGIGAINSISQLVRAVIGRTFAGREGEPRSKKRAGENISLKRFV
jgi:hypothetical protein